jgi:hypothetical protein
VYLGLGLRLGGLGLSGFDADAAAYFDRAGVTYATAKQQINAFVVGVKGLGLWNSIVCWPLRSSQNKGTGTTAYSLGGNGTFNGTLTNGPTWGSTGIVFNNTTKQIDVSYSSSFLSMLSSYAVFFCSSTDFNNIHCDIQDGLASGAYLQHRFHGQAGFGAAGVAGNTTRAGGNSYPNNNQSRSINLTTFQTSAYSVASTSDTTYQDGSVAVSGYKTGMPTRNPTGTPYILISGNSTYKIHAFQALFSVTLSDTQNSQLNSLYKTTLGTGLGLP